MTRLATRLRDIRENFESKAPEAALAVIHRATAELEASGIVDGVPAVGDVLPRFELTDIDGHVVRSADLLGRGPLVLSFYRGHW